MVLKIINFFLLVLLLIILPPGAFSKWSWETGLRWLYIFLIAFLTANLLYPFAVKLARKLNAIDVPDARKIHTQPTPRLGGVMVYLSFVFAVIRNNQFSTEIISILTGSTVIFLLGFFDDVKGLKASTRLIFQIIASLIVVYGGLKVTFTLKWGIPGEILSWIISVLWLVGITNAFNFLDGVDGLASSLGVVISLIFLAIVVNTEQYKVAFITASLVGACSGFLIYNWHPAKIFLGDSGSTLIGFLLACLGIYGGWATNNPLVALSTPIIILFIPIFDLIYTTISRIKYGRIHSIKDWLEYTGKDHLHHRLMAIGFKPKQVVLFVFLLNLVCGLIALNIVIGNETNEVFISIAEVLLVFVIVTLLMLVGRERIDLN